MCRLSSFKVAITTAILGISLFNDAQAAGNTVYLGQSIGATPFQVTLSLQVSGAPLSSVYFSILPKAGSFTRPLAASFTASYLSAQGLLRNNNLYLQAFGLYNNSAYSSYNNTVQLAFSYTDGSVSYLNVSVTTPGYTSSCPALASPTSRIHNYRQSVADLGFDFIFLKEYCRMPPASSQTPADGPAILDTDGNIRWVAADHGVASGASILTNSNKTVYTSNGVNGTDNGVVGINRIDLNTGLITPTGNFGGLLNGAYGTPGSIEYVGDHNIDPGRNGTMIVGVNKTLNGTSSAQATETNALLIETDGTNILNAWDFAQIISAAMTAGGDNPSLFVLPNGADWFHENSSVYNPADNTLIVSSRENFVIAVDYDPPANGGVKKIHWIFGDTTKQWNTFKSLSKFALTYNSPAYPPVGQHGISLDPSGNLMLMNDGTPSLSHNPAGVGPFNSFAAKYSINLKQATANSPGTATYVYGYGSYGGGSYFSSPYCGSAYDFHTNTGDSYLMDFAMEAAAGSAPVFPEQAGSVYAEVQGLRTDSSLVFDLQLPEASVPNQCAQGWNASPVDLSALRYN